MNKSNLAARVCVELFRDPVDQTYLYLKFEELNDPEFKFNFLNKVRNLSQEDYIYFYKFSQVAEVGSRLRLAHAHESDDYHECWSQEEELEWDAVSDKLNLYYENNTETIVSSDVSSDISLIISQLCRGEWPINWN